MAPKRRTKVVDVGDELEAAERDRHWHVSRSVPIAFIISMLVYAIGQTAAAAWFASSINFRVDAIEKSQIQMSPQGERLTRVEEKLEGVKTGITDIKTLLTAQDNRDRMMSLPSSRHETQK